MRLSIYDRYVLPRLTHLVMQSPQLAAYRERAADHARGDVLEIGIGSGLNLPHYGSQVRRVIGVEPSPALARLASSKADSLRFPLELHVQSAEDLPLADRSVDTALTTWSLCTIPDAARALREVRRVLRPEGHLVFVEHGRSSEPRVVAWQDRLTPLWRRCPAAVTSTGRSTSSCGTRALRSSSSRPVTWGGRRSPPSCTRARRSRFEPGASLPDRSIALRRAPVAAAECYQKLSRILSP
jgi:SAM-dependent methyltransferase